MVANVNEVIDKLFGILNDNIRFLKYEFKPLNFGMFLHFYWQGERNEGRNYSRGLHGCVYVIMFVYVSIF